jgi:FtsH-binding integral membrane protein
MMRTRFLYAFIGMIVLAGVDLLVSLLAVAIQQQPFAAQLGSTSSIVWLIVLIVAGLLLGFWLGGEVRLPAPPSQPTGGERPNTITITRLSALLSYGKLSGQGIQWLKFPAKAGRAP